MRTCTMQDFDRWLSDSQWDLEILFAGRTTLTAREIAVLDELPLEDRVLILARPHWLPSRELLFLALIRANAILGRARDTGMEIPRPVIEVPEAIGRWLFWEGSDDFRSLEERLRGCWEELSPRNGCPAAAVELARQLIAGNPGKALLAAAHLIGLEAQEADPLRSYSLYLEALERELEHQLFLLVARIQEYES